MKEILFICPIFPPQSDVGGLRPAMLCKYLPDFGYKPFVLTRDYTPFDSRYDQKLDLGNIISEDRIVRFPYPSSKEKKYLETRTLPRKFRDFLKPEYSSPPGLLDNILPIALEIVKSHHFDIIFTTVPDQWALVLGSVLSRKFGIPLISDFRDINEQEEGLKRSFRQAIQVKRLLFRRNVLMRDVSLVSTISKYHSHFLQDKYKKPTILIYNGYDPDFSPPAENSFPQSKSFNIVYIGRLLNIWYRDPSILLHAIDELISERKITQNDISINLYGTEKDILDPVLSKLQNNGFYHFHEKVSYSKIAGVLNDSQVLLLITNHGRKGILTTKLFEYIGMQKPILCVPGDYGEIDDLIDNYQLGYSVHTLPEMKDNLMKWLKLWKAGTFPTKTDNSIEFFSRKHQARILAEEFDKFLNHSKS